MRILFLQGPNTPFFERLAHRLHELGHDILRVNFCGGDRLFWNGLPAVDFTAAPGAMSDFYEDLIGGSSIDSVLLFGDRRAVHLPAVDAARRRHVRVFAFDEGYFRPNRFTMERDGTNDASSLPRDPDFYRCHAPALPKYDEGTPAPPGWRRRVYDDVAYQLWSGIWQRRYRHYQTHRPYRAGAEGLSWARRLIRSNLRRSRHGESLRRVADLPDGFFFFPLQLNTDFQIRCHSDFAGMGEAVIQVLNSFARHAPADSHLVLKNHPLDNGMIDYEALLREHAGRFDIAERVHFLESAANPELLRRCRGVVTVNSTMGLSALIHDKPVKVLGRALYDLAGLTHSGDLDSFWRALEPPDMELFRAFRNVVIHLTQINGSYYSREGQDMAIEPVIARLMAPDPDLPGG